MTTMRAAVCHEYGSPESLVIEERPMPVAGPTQVLIEVAFAALNFPDLLIIANQYQVSVPTPFIPGSEISGVVVDVGNEVTSLNVGDRVFGSVFHGAFATHLVANATSMRKVPDGVSLESTAGFWVAHSTAYHALRSVADVQPGQTVAVLGAAGGVGMAAIEVAVLRGARVTAISAGEERLAECVRMGATHTIDYSKVDVRDALKACEPAGIDVVIDPVGGPFAERALRAMSWGGRFVTVGFASGEIPRIPLNLVLLKGVIIRGFEMRTFYERAPELARRDEKELMELLASGQLKPHISSIHPLNHVGAALRKMADRKLTGKVLLGMH